MNEVFGSLFTTAGPIGCVIIGCVAVTVVGCYTVYKLIQNKRDKSRDEIDTRAQSAETRLAVLEQRMKDCEDDLKAGTLRFESFDRSLKGLDSKVGDLAVKMGELNKSFDLFLKMQGYVK